MAGSEQVVVRRQPLICYPLECEHAMPRIELEEGELDALGSITGWSPIIAQSILDCELGTPIMLALRETMGLRLAAIEATRRVVRPVYVDESGIVWRITCATMIATLEAVGRTQDGKTFVHVAEGKKVQAKVEWPFGSPRESRTAAAVLSISGPQVA